MKHNKLLLTTSFLLALGALSPMFFWGQDHKASRTPASSEQKEQKLPLAKRISLIIENNEQKKTTVFSYAKFQEKKKEDKRLPLQKRKDAREQLKKRREIAQAKDIVPEKIEIATKEELTKVELDKVKVEMPELLKPEVVQENKQEKKQEVKQEDKQEVKFDKEIEKEIIAELQAEKEQKKSLVLDKPAAKKEEAKQDDQGANCLKDDSNKLEEEIQKLIADKEIVLDEIQDKKEEKSEKLAEAKKEEAHNIPMTDNQQILGIMSNLSSLMISMQQQQQMLMMQMFSMMQNQSQVQADPLAAFYSPYAFRHETFTSGNRPGFHDYYANQFSKFGIGIGGMASPQSIYTRYDHQPQAMNYGGYPQMGYGMNAGGFNDGFNNSFSAPRTMEMRPAIQYPMPHNGFNFSQDQAIDQSNLIGANIQRIDF